MNRDDLRIIAHLQRAPRAPFDMVARTVGLDEEVVEERVSALVADDVIKFVAVTDPIVLGYAHLAMIGVVIDGPVQPVVDALVSFDHVIYLLRTQGGFQIMAEVVGTSDAHLLELVARVQQLQGVQRVHTFLYLEYVKEDYTYGGVQVD